MSVLQTLASVSVSTLLAATLGASAATPPKADEHAAHHPAAAASAPKPAMDNRVKAMREMRDKMASAKTPAERQALMADHMKAMQEGMQSMKDMSGMTGMGGMGGMGGMAGTGKGAMPADMAKHRQSMEDRMAMMQTMMEMMMQRMPATEADSK